MQLITLVKHLRQHTKVQLAISKNIYSLNGWVGKLVTSPNYKEVVVPTADQNEDQVSLTNSFSRDVPSQQCNAKH